jgi:hypothetical protein
VNAIGGALASLVTAGGEGGVAGRMLELEVGAGAGAGAVEEEVVVDEGGVLAVDCSNADVVNGTRV